MVNKIYVNVTPDDLGADRENICITCPTFMGTPPTCKITEKKKKILHILFRKALKYINN
jgi:hypothetical protein